MDPEEVVVGVDLEDLDERAATRFASDRAKSSAAWAAAAASSRSLRPADWIEVSWAEDWFEVLLAEVESLDFLKASSRATRSCGGRSERRTSVGLGARPEGRMGRGWTDVDHASFARLHACSVGGELGRLLELDVQDRSFRSIEKDRLRDGEQVELVRCEQSKRETRRL